VVRPPDLALLFRAEMSVESVKGAASRAAFWERRTWPPPRRTGLRVGLSHRALARASRRTPTQRRRAAWSIAEDARPRLPDATPACTAPSCPRPAGGRTRPPRGIDGPYVRVDRRGRWGGERAPAGGPARGKSGGVHRLGRRWGHTCFPGSFHPFATSSGTCAMPWTPGQTSTPRGPSRSQQEEPVHAAPLRRLCFPSPEAVVSVEHGAD
jgi:hypothetical protein